MASNDPSNKDKQKVQKLNLLSKSRLTAKEIIDVIERYNDDPNDQFSSFRFENLTDNIIHYPLSQEDYDELIAFGMRLEEFPREKNELFRDIILHSVLIPAAHNGWIRDSYVLKLLQQKTPGSADWAFILGTSIIKSEEDILTEPIIFSIFEYLETRDRSLGYYDNPQERETYYSVIGNLLMLLDHETMYLNNTYKDFLKNWILRDPNDWEYRYSLVMGASPDLIELLGNELPFVGEKGVKHLTESIESMLSLYFKNEGMYFKNEGKFSVYTQGVDNYPFDNRYVNHMKATIIFRIFTSSEKRFDALAVRYLQKIKNANSFPVDVDDERELEAMLRILSDLSNWADRSVRFSIFNKERSDFLRNLIIETKRILKNDKLKLIARQWKLTPSDVKSLIHNTNKNKILELNSPSINREKEGGTCKTLFPVSKH